MAISAYSSQGLLKKNPLLGTSLMADQSRAEEKRKFTGLHERAKGFKGTKEQFQSTVKQEYDAAQQPGLEAFAAGQQKLGSERTKLSEFQTKQQELQETIDRSNTIKDIFADPDVNWKKMHQRFNKANPELAREADEVWEALGENTGRKTYKKGKRSEAAKTRFQEMADQAQEELNILNQRNPELMATLEGGGAGGRIGERIDIPGVDKETFKNIGSGFENFGKDIGQSFIDVNDLRNIVTDPKKFFSSALMPGNPIKFVSSLLGSGKKAKKKRRRAKRNQKAAAQNLALLDELALRKGGAQISSMGNLGNIAESEANISGLERSQAQQRKTLEDRANFFGSFFS